MSSRMSAGGLRQPSKGLLVRAEDQKAGTCWETRGGADGADRGGSCLCCHWRKPRRSQIPRGDGFQNLVQLGEL